MITKNRTYDDLCHLVRDKRRKNGWTQEQLAEKAGVSQNYIAKIETGLVNCGFKTLTKLAIILDIPTEDLIEYNLGLYENVAKLIDKRIDLDNSFRLLNTRTKEILMKIAPIIEKYI